jgi:predicted lipoprotein with Yx(FWY)xxD motif
MNKKFNFLIVSLVVATVFVFTQCEKSDVVTVAPNPYLLKLGTSSTLGSYLTDKDGNTLYFFSNDADGANNCTAGCIANWPVFMASGLKQAKLVDGLVLADFDSITSANGKQLTYKGWPLYYYAPGGVREAPGVTTGEGIGGIWFVAKPDYTIMIANLQLRTTKDYTVSATNLYVEGTGKTIYFTDLMGRALYIYAKDSANINKWTNTDAAHNAIWPIYNTDKVVVPSTLDKTLFGSITMYGNKQLTYKGWPIYYFKTDVDAAGKYRNRGRFKCNSRCDNALTFSVANPFQSNACCTDKIIVV